MQKFLSQPFHVAEQFTGIPGAYVKVADTVRSFKEIIEGKHDDVPEQAFYMKGAIEEVKLPAKGNEKEIAFLLVKSGANTVDVYLCPQSFLAEIGVSFNKGDEISLTGSKVQQGETDLVLARELVRGNDTVVLRDEKGNPVWNWHR